MNIREHNVSSFGSRLVDSCPSFYCLGGKRPAGENTHHARVVKMAAIYGAVRRQSSHYKKFCSELLCTKRNMGLWKSNMQEAI